MIEERNTSFHENESASAKKANHKRKRPRKKNLKKLFREARRQEKDSWLSEEELHYCHQVSEDLKKLVGEDRELLAKNFLREVIQGDVKKLASHKYVSLLLDNVLQYAGPSEVVSIGHILGEDLRPTCQHPSASHVLQTVMTLSLKFLQEWQRNASDKTDVENKEYLDHIKEEERKELISLLNKIGRFVYNNLDEFITNPYGSHIFRSVLEICSGVQIHDSLKQSQKAQINHAVQHSPAQILSIPSELQDLLVDIAVRLKRLPGLPDTISNECGSAALQSAIFVLKSIGSENCTSLLNHILENGFPGVEIGPIEEAGDVHQFFHVNAAVRLMEVIISCAKEKQLNNIFEQYFKGHILDLVKHPSGNFAVQKLLLSWKEKEKFDDLFAEVCKTLPTALTVKHYGVIHSLSEACHKLGSNQGQCWKAIMQLLGCYEPFERQQAAAPCLLWFLHHDEYEEKRSKGTLPGVSLHGALILQQFLQYNKTLKIVNSLMGMNLADLQMMACDPRGSHVVDAFAASTFIKATNKESFIQRYKGLYVALACSKHGSRSLEAMWNVSSIKLKTEICNELASEELKIKGNRFGTIIFNKFQVRMFLRKDKKDWQQLVDSAAKKKRVLEEFLEDITEGEPKKKKKKAAHKVKITGKKNAEKEGKRDEENK